MVYKLAALIAAADEGAGVRTRVYGLFLRAARLFSTRAPITSLVCVFYVQWRALFMRFSEACRRLFMRLVGYDVYWGKINTEVQRSSRSTILIIPRGQACYDAK